MFTQLLTISLLGGYTMKQFFVVLSMLFLLHILLADAAFSQNQSRDVIYLKNGNIIKGEIIEQVMNTSIKVQTADGSIINYSFADIEKITKESNESQSKNVSKNFPTNKGNIMIMGNISFKSEGGKLYEVNENRRVSIELDPAVAIFITPGLALGLAIPIETESQGNDSHSLWGICPELIYMIGGSESKVNVKGTTYPFLSIGIMYGEITDKRGISSKSSSSIGAFNFGGGLCYMLSESLGLNMQISYNFFYWSPEHGDSKTGNSIGMKIGLIGFL
jgi:hypothetical protein